MKRKEKIAAFIGIEFGLVILCALPLFLLHAEPAGPLVLLTSVVFMFLPALTTLIIKRLTHDNGRLFLQLNMRKAWKQYLLAAYISGVLEGIGVVLYFFIFPAHFDHAAQLLALSGQTAELPQLSLPAVIGFGLIFILAAPLVIVNHVAAFGEEIGWRGFLLPDTQIQEYFSGLHCPRSNQCHPGSTTFDLSGFLQCSFRSKAVRLDWYDWDFDFRGGYSDWV